MTEKIERNLGEQPLAAIMAERGLKTHHLVVASGEQLTHKMVSRACKGRRLTPHAQAKVMRALNAATGESFALQSLFNYGPAFPGAEGLSTCVASAEQVRLPESGPPDPGAAT